MRRAAAKRNNRYLCACCHRGFSQDKKLLSRPVATPSSHSAVDCRIRLHVSRKNRDDFENVMTARMPGFCTPAFDMHEIAGPPGDPGLSPDVEGDCPRTPTQPSPEQQRQQKANKHSHGARESHHLSNESLDPSSSGSGSPMDGENTNSVPSSPRQTGLVRRVVSATVPGLHTTSSLS